MTTVDIPAQSEGNADASAADTPSAVSMAPLVDSTKLLCDPWDSAVVRASHRIYEHLIAMFAPGLIDSAFELGVFTALAKGPATAACLAQQLDADPHGVRILLDGLSCYEIVLREQDLDLDPEHRYRLAPGMAECLLPDGLYSLAGRISYDRTTGWQAWKDFAHNVKRPPRNELGDYGANQLSATDYESVARGINFWAPPIVETLCRLLGDLGWTPEESRTMVDIGCGTGIYSHLLLQHFDGLHATALDDKRIVPIALEQAAVLGVDGRFEPFVKDFFTDDWGSGHDLVLLVNIIHLQNEAGAQELVHKAFKAVGDNGVVAIIDNIIDDRSDPQSIQNRFFRLFAASMLVTGGGDSYSLPEYDQWLATAGLTRIALVDTPMHRILLARHA
jgi:SAM-dependent methyltransferase